ncbi:MAG: hypothetical protein WCB03_19590 [Rouxiella badensis]|uniref:hypothetical protein n=1 Tax=Rouxiella badensis TaxID=1646377 RepID=UPI003C5E3C08
MAICKSRHRYWNFLGALPDDQGGIGRHKCCGCAYEKGYQAGLTRSGRILVDLNSLHESQAGTVRHKSPQAAYAKGYYEGVQASYQTMKFAV